LKLLDVDIARVKPPEGNELFLVNIPEFLGVRHKEFDYATYEPPAKPHDGSDSKFSPFSTANTTIMWRRDPQKPEKLQSNARIIRWSDGSLTLQLASKPTEQYRISANALRADWPKKQEHYDPQRETHHYLGAPHATSGCDLQIVAPFDATLKIQPTGDTADEAINKLKQSIKAKTELNDAPSSFKSVREDPELAKKKAEQAEKDVAKAQRRREAAQERQMGRRDKVLGGRFGGRSAGLTVGELEDDMPSARGKAKSRRRKTNRNGEIYSDDDEDGRGRRQDEYDHDDGFLADSDEEPETYEDDDLEEPEAEDDPDHDDLEIPGRKTVIDGARTRGERDRDRTPKRARDEFEDDAEAEDDPDAARPARRKQNRVLSDEESE
jgi:RNA polymerase-associated protein LEO1